MPRTQSPSPVERDPRRWLPHSPFRPPEWRWRRAEYLAATGRRIDRRLDDGWVVTARRLLTPRGAKSEMVTVRGAYAVWTGDPERRSELEAWLLTAASLAEVARRFALSEAVVEAYERVFFAVRVEAERATDWRMLQAVGYNPWEGFTLPLPFAAWKYAAVTGGPLALLVMVAVTTGRPLPVEVVPAGGGDERAAAVREKTLLLIAALAARTDAEFAEVIRAHRRLRATTGDRQPEDPMLDMMEQLLLAVPGWRRDADPGFTDLTTREEEQRHGQEAKPATAGQEPAGGRRKARQEGSGGTA